MEAALVTPFLGHLPLHPSSYLGYGTAILTPKYRLDIIDLNAEIYFENRHSLKKTLLDIEERAVVFDSIHFSLLYNELSGFVEQFYETVHWDRYRSIFITTPTWFVTIPTEDVLKLSDHIRRESQHSEIYFFGNSLGSWTDEKKLIEHNIQIRHLNDLFKVNPCNEPVNYDSLPTPVYEDRKIYIFDIIPFRLKHGCIWGKCRFCSLAKGWNSGYMERSAENVIQEMEELIANYHPKMLICRDNSINGNNLRQFCTYFEKFKKPWIGMARADLTGKEIKALQRAGCRLIYFGLESGSDRVLKEINKGIGSRQMSDFINRLHDHNIIPAPSLFVGSPGETEVDFEKTVQFILDHKNYLDIINLYPLRITPASDISLTRDESHNNTLIRLNKLIKVCEDIGIKVCVGEQSGEYVFCKKVYSVN
jgi:radical SAM superfamily enzyme YgiQ (UPF0313 family)